MYEIVYDKKRVDFSFSKKEFLDVVIIPFEIDLLGRFWFGIKTITGNVQAAMYNPKKNFTTYLGYKLDYESQVEDLHIYNDTITAVLRNKGIADYYSIDGWLKNGYFKVRIEGKNQNTTFARTNNTYWPYFTM